MLLDALLPARLRRSVAVAATGALLATGAAVMTAAPAQAAVLGAPTLSPTSGNDSTLFGGTIANAECPGGTDSTFWSVQGGDIAAGTYEGYLGDGVNNGAGAQEFSGASVANLKTVTGKMAVAGTYRVVFHCFAGAAETNTYEQAFSYDPASGGSWSVVTAPVTTVPGAPGTPSATAPASGASVTLSWAAPSSNGGAAITGYQIQVTKNGVVQPTTVSAAGSPTTVTGLTNGTPYTFKVAATNSVGTGEFSAASNAVTPRAATKLVLSSAPTKLTYGIAFKVVGKLTRSNGTTAVPSQYVYLQVRKKGTTSYVNVVKVLSSSTGTASLSYKPVFAIDALRLYKPTTAADLGSLSAGKAVTTQRRITTTWSARQIYLGRSATLTGYVYPKASGRRITLQRRSGTSWVTVAYKTLPTTTYGYSRYTFTVKPGSRATHYYRVIVAAGSGYTTSVAYAPSLKVV